MNVSCRRICVVRRLRRLRCLRHGGTGWVTKLVWRPGFGRSLLCCQNGLEMLLHSQKMSVPPRQRESWQNVTSVYKNGVDLERSCTWTCFLHHISNADGADVTRVTLKKRGASFFIGDLAIPALPLPPYQETEHLSGSRCFLGRITVENSSLS